MLPPGAPRRREVEMLREFRDFVSNGNFVDIAVAFVVGIAFGSVVTAFTQRLVSPLIGIIVTLPSLERIGQFGPEDPATGVPTGSVGAFIEAFLNFLIIAFVMFLVVKAYTRFREEKPAEPPEDVVLLREIRDELRGSRSHETRGGASAEPRPK
jgi:large conductance mechanosensitive channel